MTFPKYHAAYQKLLSLSNLERTDIPRSPDSLAQSLNNVKLLLKLLNNPEQELKFVHVTGTSGKGSVTRLMHEMLYQAGAKVGSYSSPHTTTYLERYRINNRLADPDKLAKAIETVLFAYTDYLKAGHEPLNFFSLNTCIALVLCVQTKVHWCILEVGMGGRFDSTNVIPTPVIAIITNIDLDHTQSLGPTKNHIAKEKSGIIKPGCTVITGETDSVPLKVIKAEAKRQQAPLTIIPNVANNHLQHNADICRAAGRHLGIHQEIIEDCVTNTCPLPGRLEVIQTAPRVIIDGAHNVAKMAATVTYIQQHIKGKVLVIFGCKHSKDATSMADTLAKIASRVYTTRSTDTIKKSSSPFKLLNLFPTKLRGQAYLFPEDALAAALKAAKKSDTILVTGSLYLAGELRTHWRTEEQILSEQES
jgi:dihydrofolate synthase / folylpolyglutamate synthase